MLPATVPASSRPEENSSSSAWLASLQPLHLHGIEPASGREHSNWNGRYTLSEAMTLPGGSRILEEHEM